MKINKYTNKKIYQYAIYLTLGYLIFGLFVFSAIPFKAIAAATPTPKEVAAITPSAKPSQNQLPTDSADLEKIQKIKDIVASKVAELNLVEKRGIIGTIREINGMKITINDNKGNTRQIDIDELTKFNITEINSDVSDLKKGDTYSFIGIYNKDSERLLARSVNTASSIPVYFEGAIVSVDEKEYQIIVVNEKGEKKTIDIQNSTRTSLASATGDLIKSGFSKLEKNSRVLAIGFWNKKDKNILAALRVIHFKDVPPSKEMQSFVTAPSQATK